MIRKLLTLMFCLSLITAGFSSSTVEASSWTAKIDPWLMEQGEALESGESIEFLVFLSETADLSGLDPSWTKQEKGTYVFEKLTETAQNTQEPVLKALESLGAETRAYWVANMIWARGSWQAVEAMASRQDVRKIYGNPQVKVDLPESGTTPNLDVNPDAIEWNILKVNADDVWALGITGEGVVIGGQDTGYDWDHPGLVNQYREQFPGYGRHDFNWHDAIHEGGSSCGADSPVPCDDYGHGTHTMGTMVGDDGGVNQVGMAPGAQWIGCRNMNNGNGTPATYTECFEFFLAPYPVGGDPMDGDPTLAPDVISNSWGCPSSEGCALDELLAIVSAVRDAGIMVVASAGNEGPNCGSVVNPIGIYDQTFSVGATDSNDNIAGFSSRGPASWDGNVFLKPDISAPGSNVRSTIPGTGYGSMSGTSMAAPHVAGLVALLISANPDLAGQVDLLEQIIEGSAVPRTTTQDCGGVSGDDVPNNTYGWGRIDALAAVESIPAAPIAGFTAPATAYTGEPVQFVDTTSGMGPFTYFWMFGDGLGTSTEQNPVYTYMTPGIFTITQTVTNTYGADSFSGIIEVLPLVALDSVSVTLETTGTIYPDSSVDFSAMFGPDDLTMPITYTLDFGDGSPVVTSTLEAFVLDFSHVYTDSGTFMVTLQAWNYLMDPSDAIEDTVEVLVTPTVVDFRLFLPLILK